MLQLAKLNEDFGYHVVNMIPGNLVCAFFKLTQRWFCPKKPPTTLYCLIWTSFAAQKEKQSGEYLFE